MARSGLRSPQGEATLALRVPAALHAAVHAAARLGGVSASLWCRRAVETRLARPAPSTHPVWARLMNDLGRLGVSPEALAQLGADLEPLYPTSPPAWLVEVLLRARYSPGEAAP